MRLFTGLLATSALTLSLSANAQISWYNDIRNATGYIDAEGREWLPALVDGVPLGSQDPIAAMSAQCNVLTGWCGDQWDSLHWASMDEVAQMITEITGQPLMTYSNDGASALAIELGLGYTSAPPGYSFYTAVTRDGNLLNVDVRTDYHGLPYYVNGIGDYQIEQCAPNTYQCRDTTFTALAWVAVPEPSTLAVMGVGVGAVLLARRKRPGTARC
jgi:hypothetical protein